MSVRNLSQAEVTKAVDSQACRFKKANYHLTKVELDLPKTAEGSDDDTEYEDDHFFKSKSTPKKSPSALKKKLKDKKHSNS